jgi:anti-anti-sigma regulatory factor
MTLKIEKSCDSRCTSLRLIGRIRSEDLVELKSQLGGDRLKVVLDLGEVTIVDANVIRFLMACEAKGIEFLHCPPFIREWILGEQDRRG